MKKAALILITLCLCSAFLCAAGSGTQIPIDKVKKTLASIDPDWVLISWLESETPNYWSLILREKDKDAIGTERILSLYQADTENGKRWVLHGLYADEYFWVFMDEAYISQRREKETESIRTRLENMCQIVRGDFIMPFSMQGANRILEQVTRESVAANLYFSLEAYPPDEALADTSYVELMADNSDWIDQYEMDFMEKYGYSNEQHRMFLAESEATYYIHSVIGRTLVLMAIGNIAHKGEYVKLVCYLDLVTGTHRITTHSSKEKGESGDWSLPKD